MAQSNNGLVLRSVVGVESREDSQEDPRCDDDRQDWPDVPGSDLPA